MAINERGGVPVDLIVGPCSINENNIQEVLKLSQIQVRNLKGLAQPALFGTRIVGLKSRTAYNPTGQDMGIDFDVLMQNMLILQNGGNVNDFITPPSVNIAREVIRETGMTVGTEVMMPHIQSPIFDREITEGKMLLWSPSVEALGWSILPSAEVVKKRSDWLMGLKNPKWLGAAADEANVLMAKETSMEKAWKGLVTYATGRGVDPRQVVMIQRGVDVPEKGPYRNLPVHKVAERTKASLPDGVRMYFDPSHTLGPKKRDEIVEATIEALLLRDGKNNFIYDGALIEAGNSTTDTDQHLTLDEVEILARELARFRNLRSPERV